MIEFKECEERKCFANCNEKCAILTSVYENKKCPFFKTHDEVDAKTRKLLAEYKRQIKNSNPNE